jgi:hypothetical protein
MVSNLLLTANFVDVQKPVLTIVSPLTHTRVSNNVVVIKGTVMDNGLVSAVWYQDNDGAWSKATGTVSWTTAITLIGGTNTLRAYAQDTAGNLSATNTVSVVYVVTAPLVVQTTGLGTLSPNYSNAVLEIGRSFTMTAKPGAGSVFSNWVDGAGSLLTNGVALKFVMQSNLVLRANFIPNPFRPGAGNYAGLFYDTNGAVTVSNAGYISASVTKAGKLTAKLQVGAVAYSLSGQLSLTSGWGTNVIKGAPGMGAWLQLSLDGRDEITGQLSNKLWSAEITANRAVYSKTNVAPLAGRYTLVIPGGEDPANLPGGHGAAAVNVSSVGAVSVSGILGDGTAVTESTVVSKEGQWPFYRAFYSGRGILIGWITFTNDPTTTSDMEGVVSWIKPGKTGTKLYPNGFDWPYDSETNNAFGSTFTNRTPLLSWTNGVAILENGNLAQGITNGLNFGNAGKVTGTNKLNLKITTSGNNAGLFKGSVVNPVTGKRITVNGALLQKQDVGYGSFLGTNQSGSVSLAPTP